MSLTRVASRWLRNKPSGSIITWEDLKTKFLSKYCPHARTAEKMEEINNFQQEPDETLYQAWERFKELLMKCPQHYFTEMQEVILFYNRLDVQTRHIFDSKGAIPSKTVADAKVNAAQVGCEQCKGPHYTKDYPLKEEGKTLEEAYYTQFGGPFQGGGYRAAAPGFYQGNNANPSYQERRKSMEETLSKFMSESAKRHEENSNMIKEIQASTDAVVRNQKASIKTLEIQIGQISKVLQERGFGSLPSSTKPTREIMSSQFRPLMKLIQTRYAVLDHPNTTRLNDYYWKEKKGSYRLQFSEAYLYEALHIDNSIPQKEKDPGSFTLPCYINNVCFDNALADLGASISVMPLSTYLNLGLGELAHTKLTVELAYRTMKYPKGITENVLVEARLMGETLALNRSLGPLNGDYIELNDLNVPLELRRDQVDDFMPTIEEGEVIDEPMIDIIKTRNNERFDEHPIMENMDGYRDQDMGDIILGEPFCKASCMEVIRFDGLITIYNGSDNVTYQMARSHPRFKHLSNAQCNKIKSLLKVSLHDKLNEISHPYQKLKSFYKGVLQLGPEYV
ncbi:hypothetical protein Tco_1148318 [Tanacetum coccineum]